MQKHVTSTEQGFSTLEIMVAFVILILSITAIIGVIFGGLSLGVDAQTNDEALMIAHRELEEAQADARKDFRIVNPDSGSEDIYQTELAVETLPDFFTKKIRSIVTWPGENNRAQTVELTTLLTNLENTDGGSGNNTCNSELVGDWSNPNSTDYDFALDIMNEPVSKYPITSVLAHQNRLYVTINNLNTNNSSTFAILDISNPAVPPDLLGDIDNTPELSRGFNSVAIGGEHAFLANAHEANYTSCAPGYECGQLQVMNVSNPSNITPVNSYKIPGVGGSGGQAVGRSIFYKDDYIYMGLATSTGPEFNIINVSNPASPVKIGGYEFNGSINGIYVRGTHAYVTSPKDDEELTVLDISNPALPTKVGTFNAPDGGGNFGNGKSVFVVNDTAYLGRTFLNGDEFYILSDSNPGSDHTPPLGSKDIGSSVNGIIVRDYLAFLVTTSGQFHILRVDNPSAIVSTTTPITLPGSASLTGAGLACESNYFYIGSNDSNNHGYVTVIKPGP